MAWFAAHVVVYFKWKDQEQRQFRVWENTHLIEADTVEEARSKAIAHGRRSEGDDRGTLTSDGHPATCVFAGVRRVISVAHEASGDRLGDGDEISFLPFLVEDEAGLQALADGRPTSVLYFEEGGEDSSGVVVHPRSSS